MENKPKKLSLALLAQQQAQVDAEGEGIKQMSGKQVVEILEIINNATEKAQAEEVAKALKDHPTHDE